jgi:hypothetical protein
MGPSRRWESGEDAVVSCQVPAAIRPAQEADEQDGSNDGPDSQEGAEHLPADRESRHSRSLGRGLLSATKPYGRVTFPHAGARERSSR